MKQVIILVIFSLSGFSFLQSQTIRGTVVDDQNQIIPNVSISVKNTFTGTISANDGSFSLKLPFEGPNTIIFKSVGYEQVEKEVSSTGENILQVVLNKSINNLQEVTVTASRKPEIIDRTPASVQVINSRDIQTQGLISPNIANILAQALPALAFGSNTTSNVGQTLRGRTPLIMIDGIPQSTPLRAGGRDIRTIDPSVIERIEVVKGATAIYGNGADGGIINYITKKPGTGKKINLSTQLSNTGMPLAAKESFGGRISQEINGQLNKFDYIVTGTYEKTGVFKDAEGTPLTPVYGLGETNIFNVFTKLGYNINATNRIEGMYNFFGSRQNTSYIEQAGIYGEKPTIGVKGDYPGESEGTRYNHNAYLKYQAKGLPFNTNLEASAYLQSFYTIYGFTSYFQNGGQSTISSDKKGFRLNMNTPYQVNSSWQGDIVYGVDIMNDVTAQILMDGRTWVPKIDLFNTAPYIQANAVFNKNWIFKAGYRFDHINIDIPSFTQVMAANGTGGNQINGGSLSFNASTFNTGLRYAKWDFLKPFISFTQGFSIIDVGRYVRAAKENDIANMQIEPVKVNNYEIGFSGNAGRLGYTGSYFISTNKIGSSLIEENGWYVQQKSPEKTYGFELAADYQVIDPLTIGVAYMFTEGKADKNRNDRFNDDEDIYLNSTKISPPKTTAYIKLQPAKSVNLLLQWLQYGDRNRFVKRSNGSYGYGEGPVEDAHVVNFSGSWMINPKFSLNLGIENLLNQDYYMPQAQWSTQHTDYIKANGMRYQLGIGIKW